MTCQTGCGMFGVVGEASRGDIPGNDNDMVTYLVCVISIGRGLNAPEKTKFDVLKYVNFTESIIVV